MTLNAKETFELIERISWPADEHVLTHDEARALLGLISPKALADVARDMYQMVRR